ncbi:MAG: hypothetical protein ACR2NJ_12415 [Acidimicrobiales bacterium]
MRQRSAKDVAVVTHSQGGMEARWAIRWWPSARSHVADLLMLASPNHGIVTADLCAASGNCWPAVWQMASGSRFLRALDAVEDPSGVAITNIYSLTDELVEPASTVALSGPNVSNAAIQQFCKRVVNHAGLLDDSVAWALVVDALGHPGPAVPGRVPASVCAQLFAPGLGGAEVLAGNAALYADAVTKGFAGTLGVRSEPALRAYATGG